MKTTHLAARIDDFGAVCGIRLGSTANRTTKAAEASCKRCLARVRCGFGFAHTPYRTPIGRTLKVSTWSDEATVGGA